MKIGLRTPSLKKMIKARTTGRAKRALKKAVNPLYGKKGVGLITNPKKAIYNKIYNKTTIGLTDISSSAKKSKTSKQSIGHNQSFQLENKTINPNNLMTSEQTKYMLLGCFLGWLGLHNFYDHKIKKGIAQLLITVLSFGLLFWVSWIWAIIEMIMFVMKNKLYKTNIINDSLDIMPENEDEIN